jgi:membrane protease YdiL (CAAX protease family)
MLRKILVFVEIILVFFAGTLAARFVLKSFGITGSKQAIQSAATTNFDPLSVAVPMIIRWSIVIGLAFIVGWVIARHRLRDYGLTLAQHSVYWHLRAGIVTLAFGFLPVLILFLLRHYLQLKGGPELWNLLENAPRNLNFWLFMLASSIILPPLVEEIFFRGYAQTRFMSVFTPTTAVIIVAILFVLAHIQYFDGTLVGTLMLVLGLWEFIVLGFSRIRTGSLLAPLFAHAILNIPLRLEEQWILAILLSFVVVGMLRTRQRHRVLL